MNGISKQKSIGFGFKNEAQFKKFLELPEIKKLGINVQESLKDIPKVGQEGLVSTKVCTLMMGDDVLHLNNGCAPSLPLQETGEDAFEKLAKRIPEKLPEDRYAILPHAVDFARSTCFRPISDAAKTAYKIISEAIAKVV